jgi:hypothetical protein
MEYADGLWLAFIQLKTAKMLDSPELLDISKNADMEPALMERIL